MTYQENRKQIRKVFIIELILLAIVATVMMIITGKVLVHNQNRVIPSQLEKLNEAVTSAATELHEITENNDTDLEGRLGALVYMAEKDRSYQESELWYKELRDSLDVQNLYLLKQDGTVLISTSDADNMQKDRKDILASIDSPEVYSVLVTDNSRYYSYQTGKRIFVLEIDQQEFARIQNNVYTENTVLAANTGTDKLMFIVRADGSLDYLSDEYNGRQASEVCGDLEALGTDPQWIRLGGERYFAGKIHNDALDIDIISGLSSHELHEAGVFADIVILAIIFIAESVMICYTFFARRERDLKNDPKNTSYNRETVQYKAWIISILGLCVILVSSWYIQTLFALSRYTMDDVKEVETLQTAYAQSQKNVETIREVYNGQYLIKAQTAARIFADNPQLQTREELAELSQIMGIDFMIIFDREGDEVVTDGYYVNFSISDDPESQSYAFRPLLQGTPYVIQEAQASEVDGVYMQYIGASIVRDGIADGFVQIAVSPEILEKTISLANVESIIDHALVSASDTFYAVNAEDGTFTYYPGGQWTGAKATDHGFTEAQLSERWCNTLTVDNVRYFATSRGFLDGYIYVASPIDRIYDGRLEFTVAMGLLNLLCYAILTFFMRDKGSYASPSEAEEEHESNFVDVETEDGLKQTVSVRSRWSSHIWHWDDKNPEQKTADVLGTMMSIFVLVIVIMVIVRREFMDQNSVLLYVIGNQWRRGLNIFAFTAVFLLIIAAFLAVAVIKWLLKMLSRILGPRGETVTRLLLNFVEYISVLAVLFESLSI